MNFFTSVYKSISDLNKAANDSVVSIRNSITEYLLIFLKTIPTVMRWSLSIAWGILNLISSIFFVIIGLFVKVWIYFSAYGIFGYFLIAFVYPMMIVIIVFIGKYVISFVLLAVIYSIVIPFTCIKEFCCRSRYNNYYYSFKRSKIEIFNKKELEKIEKIEKKEHDLNNRKKFEAYLMKNNFLSITKNGKKRKIFEIKKLPREIVVEIFCNYLTIFELVTNTVFVCKYFKSIIDEDYIWKYKYFKDLKRKTGMKFENFITKQDYISAFKRRKSYLIRNLSVRDFFWMIKMLNHFEIEKDFFFENLNYNNVNAFLSSRRLSSVFRNISKWVNFLKNPLSESNLYLSLVKFKNNKKSHELKSEIISMPLDKYYEKTMKVLRPSLVVRLIDSVNYFTRVIKLFHREKRILETILKVVNFVELTKQIKKESKLKSVDKMLKRLITDGVNGELISQIRKKIKFCDTKI